MFFVIRKEGFWGVRRRDPSTRRACGRVFSEGGQRGGRAAGDQNADIIKWSISMCLIRLCIRL
jgi:hypothetical protein